MKYKRKDKDPDFFARLETVRKKIGITWDRLAEVVGLASSTGLKEKRKSFSSPSIYEVFQWANALNHSPAWLAWTLGPEQLNDDVSWEIMRLVAALPVPQRLTILKELSKAEVPVVEPVKKVTLDWSNLPQFEERPRRRNDRDILPIYRITQQKNTTARHAPTWMKIAAGPGKELRRSMDTFIFDTLDDSRSIHAAYVQGDSMNDTLIDGDCVVLDASYGDEGLQLEALDTDEPKGPLGKLENRAPDNKIYVLSINNEMPTLKRLRYQRGHDWRLYIEADNISVWKSYALKRSDTLTIFARVIGRGEQAK